MSCTEGHWNLGNDICADCGEDLNPPSVPVVTTCPYEYAETLEASTDPVDQIVLAIWRDLSDRSGGDEFEGEIAVEMLKTWGKLVRERML